MTSSLSAHAVLFSIALFGSRAFADAAPTKDAAAPAVNVTTLREQQAAQAFEEGVERFRRADYRAAAAAFLRADELSANDDALANAIAAARRANDHLVVVSASQRALAREAASPQLAANAREALAQAERHLSRLELACLARDPCTIAVDGTTVRAGTLHVLPGIHRVSAVSARQQGAEQLLETAAGSSYRVELSPQSKHDPARASAAPSDPKTATRLPTGRDRAKSPKKPLSPAVFWASVGIGAGLLAATTWSGFDTLAARRDLPDPPTREQLGDLEERIVRTDVLLVATTVVAAATTYAGFALVDWGSTPTSAARPFAVSF